MWQRVWDDVAAHKQPLQWDKETFIIIGIMCVVALWTADRILTAGAPKEDTGDASGKAGQAVSRAAVPLATGKEPIETIFVQSGCPVCHTIPGIRAAQGREGPKLELGTTARKRLANPGYHGTAGTEWEYVQESILNPGAYLVEGYPDRVMPGWYGRKLSAAALDKMIHYLLRIEAVS